MTAFQYAQQKPKANPKKLPRLAERA